MKVKISRISYHLPDRVEGEEELKSDNPDWDMPKIIAKTGIHKRRIASEGETAVDLAYEAANKLFSTNPQREEIDLLILVTQSPDYVLPPSACILQNRLGLSQNCMAFDVNLGCSGFVYALSIAGGLIESGAAHKSLILCADTYSKYIAKTDRTCRPLFSDGAAAVLVEAAAADCVGPFDFGTDGAGYDRLIVKNSGARDVGLARGALEMRGSEVFLFTMRVVPPCINKLLDRAGLTFEDIDLFVFHQASRLVIENLVRTMSLDESKVYTNLESIGNTVSASIPIALKDAEMQKRLKEGDTVMLVGFGVGLSWGATLIKWCAA
ncbi:ketoacyl-ACP synthase III [Candidatus Methylospira mobilis]|uniref:Ketoacyl-ACP synthase III n=1 Tax=Candidatus Methylospira mobilis TaxID=1808979 RepID=A0A5Q0BQZ3_9GAMM|nr:ketoacyl-ACP synthase III [Candidatus Methylospira mobilis]QFY44497.1 ketoacyl-ACP synthase III [Candidatus Methylospira mobilis]WNV06073.1 ketoacyl-ACP synthase III [Candidatus Methylospira mobilis]